MQPRLERRKFLRGALGCGCGLCLWPASIARAATSPRRFYCVYGAVEVGEPENLIELKKTALDRMATAERSRARPIVEYLAEEDKLLPEFFGAGAPIYYDPGTRVSAYTDYTRIESTFIALGQGFIATYASGRMLEVAAIVAHEESHVYQLTSTIKGLVDRGGFRVKYIELHADYMAGAYLAWRTKYRPQSPASLISDFFAELPGTTADYSSYHGSPKERYAAFNQGSYDFPGLRLGSGPPADAAALQGLKYVEVLLRS
jgi:hypothetical protein